MKRNALAFALIASASAAPAFADVALDGTVISTMGDRTVVTLTPRERGIGDQGIVTATSGERVTLNADRVLLEREQAQADETVDAYRFPSNNSAVTQYGAR